MSNFRSRDPKITVEDQDGSHDSVYSNREEQIEYLRAEGYSDEEIEEILAEGSDETEKSHEDFDYEQVDDCLQEAHEKAVQWGVTEESPDLSKAPGVWEHQDEVPQYVLDKLKELIRAGSVVWQGDYEKLPPGAAATVQKVLEDTMTQPQGWSLQSLESDLRDELGDLSDDLDSEYLLTILRNETSAVLNTAREEAYEDRDDDREYVYDWIGPTDHRTTDTCLAIEERIEDEGGAVPMDRLKQILFEEALAHADAEGTPQRVDDWQPHWQCRRTFTRRVQNL